MRLLYIDDEDDIRDLVVFALGLDTALEVNSAASGAEGLDLYNTFRPDAVLLDVMMPSMDGPEVLSAIRKKPGGEDVPVIFVTARAFKEERERLMALGAKGVITKPFDPMTLPTDVRAILAEPVHG